MTIFTDWPELEQEPFKCPCCGYNRYKPVSTVTNKKQPEITTRASGMIKVSNRKFVDVEIVKDFAECLSCRYRTLLDETETIISKESKKEIAARLAETKFKGHFLDTGSG
ncbi:MAG TPA: hypothetical protein ENH87_02075 [Pricia antarctica]|uniref:Uncharacterized protein n=1 Tax=Pricia antarctica TaxID=641691 RepID=A0A831QJA8_9FLAO|nr:hypothetical protein [Pricia antarctica]